MKIAGKAFSCPWLLICKLLNKRTVRLGENSSKYNTFIDGKQSMENFDTTNLHGFHSWENRTCTRKIPLKSFQQVRMTNDTANKTYKSTILRNCE